MPTDPRVLHIVYPDVTSWDAYVYGRSSNDPTKKGRSVASQLDDGVELCDEQGWPVVGLFDGDIDRSASRWRRREREDFESMLEGIRAGKCRIVVAYEASRYYRDLEQYVRLRNACMDSGVLLCYGGTVYDLSKKEDRRITAQDAMDAEEEADATRKRIMRGTRSSAKKGTPHGRILYGYKRVYDPDSGDLLGQVPDPVTGPVVKEVFRRVAEGEAVNAIMVDLNARGIRARVDRAWENHNLYHLLRNPGYIGRRVYQGEDFGAAQWDALISRESWDAVQRIVSDPSRRTSESVAVVHLLSGLVWCGRCGTALRVKGDKRGAEVYYCPGGQHVVMLKQKLEAYVLEGLLAWLGSPAAAAAFQPERTDETAQQERELLAMRQQLGEARGAAADFGPDGKPKLSVVSLAALEEALSPRIADLEKRVEAARAGTPPVLRSLIGADDVEAVWAGMDLPQRRTVVRTVVRVTLNQARARGVRTIEPGRIDMVYVGQPGWVPTQRANRGVR